MSQKKPLKIISYIYGIIFAILLIKYNALSNNYFQLREDNGDEHHAKHR